MNRTITLPREVVERALAALDAEDPYRAAVALRAALEQPQNHVPDTENMVSAGWKLVPVEPNCSMVLAGERSLEQHDFLRLDSAYRAMLDAAPQPPAVEQPQSDQPAMTPIAQRKLDSLMASGYTISGYSVYHERKHQHGFVTGAGLVGWWKPEGMEYPQPLGEQDPVAFIRNRIGEDFSIRLNRVVTAEDFAGDTENFLAWCRGNADHGWRPLYTRPQPKREPLTDEQWLKLWTGRTGQRLKPGPDRDRLLRRFRFSERAHGIGGEE